MKVLHFWIYTQQEMWELQPALSKRLIVRDMWHDSENTWEYMFGKSNALNAEINVSREDAWKDYLPEVKPLHILLSFKKTRKRLTRIDKLGRKLQRHFRTTVFYGTLRHIEGTAYEFIPHQTFSASQPSEVNS